MRVTDIVYQGGGFTASFDDGSVATGIYKLNRSTGKMDLIGLTTAQRDAVDAFELDDNVESDGRFTENTLKALQARVVLLEQQARPGFPLKLKEKTISFSAESSQDVTIIMPTRIYHIANARIGIETPGSAFASNLEVTNYSSSDFHSSSAVARFLLTVARTQLSSDAGAGSSTIQVDDTDDFSVDDLLLLTDGSNSEYVRADAVGVSDIDIEDNLTQGFLENDSVCRIAEFGDLLWSDNDAPESYGMFLRFTFDSPQTIDLTLKIYYV